VILSSFVGDGDRELTVFSRIALAMLDDVLIHSLNVLVSYD
jgi:hypothetical protein